MATLRPGQWLNDEVINYFVAMLKRRAAADATGDAAANGLEKFSLDRVYLHNTMFYAKLAESASGYCYANVRRWTKRDKV
eukprot:scaffold39174_cov26-Tisochrysis_lutea.AAC.2